MMRIRAVLAALTLLMSTPLSPVRPACASRGPLAPGALVVTEFLFRPASGDPEWIELRNVSATPLSLAGVTLSDRRGPARQLSGAPASLQAGKHLLVSQSVGDLRRRYLIPAGTEVVTLSGGWIALNNGSTSDPEPADEIVLRRSGVLMDSVAYAASWAPDPGESVERVDVTLPGWDPRAWSASPAGSGPTPGAPPRAGTGDLATSSTISALPGVFDPGREVCVVCLRRADAGLPARAQLLVLSLDGRIVRRVWSGTGGAGTLCAAWNGRDDAGRELPDGLYLALFESGGEGARFTTGRTRVVIARGEGVAP